MENEENFDEVIPSDWVGSPVHSTEKSAPSKKVLPGSAVVTKERGKYVAYTQVPKGTVQFLFSEIAFSKQSVEAVVEIHMSVSDAIHPVFTQRVDLRSSSARKSLATDLNAAYGDKKAGYNWVLILNVAFNEVIIAIQEDQQPVDVSDQAYEDLPFLAAPFLQTGVSNVLFAQSEAGKTWFALRLGMSLITGGEFLGFQFPGGSRVLFLDYEDSQRVFTNRLYNLAAGMGLKFKDVSPSFHYYKPTGSFRSNTEHIKAAIERGGYSLIIIDAGGDAAGGSPSDEEKVLDLFNALEEIPITKLILHHEPKYIQNEAAAFYGSMYWKARSRVAWRLQVESEEVGKKLIKATIQKRSNLPYMDPIYYHLVFDSLTLFEDHEPGITLSVRMEKVNPEELNKERPVEDLCAEVLEKHGELTTNQISELIGKERSWTYRALQGMQKAGTVEQKTIGKGVVWMLKNLDN